ncbi:platelet glycoprotein Ib alpha chain-like [Melanotaenia boesemani]|uniref:platelet glycoprotein Ib alpha chain-like n=1 Tax=Melanotaenia boesemani TaxID=1250792 RepID=UPI001C048342|nr:platelet glycoprotein Ib alpha chain-like [Melanotaenia boesemani]
MKSKMKIFLLMIFFLINSHATNCHGRHRSSSESDSVERGNPWPTIDICALFPVLCPKPSTTLPPKTTTKPTTTKPTTTQSTEPPTTTEPRGDGK